MQPKYSLKVRRLLRRFIILAGFTLCLCLFMLSPFYSQIILKMLNQWVDVRVDPVAANGQKNINFPIVSIYEPGSAEWVAQQAYLVEINQILNTGNETDFSHLQERYQQLLHFIALEKQQKKSTEPNKSKTKKSALDSHTQEEIENTMNIPALPSSMEQYQSLIADNEQTLFERYYQFLHQKDTTKSNEYVPASTSAASLPQQKKIDLAKILQNEQVVLSPLFSNRPDHQPHAIVVLGGGLARAKDTGQIILNAYTEKRLQKAVEIYHKYHLPILLSGVESPYMQKWLKQHGIEAQLLEKQSLNTCENTRFSALLLQRQGGAPTILLVTDAYHMPRVRQLFAKNGIETIAVNAPLPNPLTAWQPSRQNWMHSRRANYELLALLRSQWLGESNCREVP